jgi:hypothetical protein
MFELRENVRAAGFLTRRRQTPYGLFRQGS